MLLSPFRRRRGKFSGESVRNMDDVALIEAERSAKGAADPPKVGAGPMGPSTPLQVAVGNREGDEEGLPDPPPTPRHPSLGLGQKVSDQIA